MKKESKQDHQRRTSRFNPRDPTAVRQHLRASIAHALDNKAARNGDNPANGSQGPREVGSSKRVRKSIQNRNAKRKQLLDKLRGEERTKKEMQNSMSQFDLMQQALSLVDTSANATVSRADQKKLQVLKDYQSMLNFKDIGLGIVELLRKK